VTPACSVCGYAVEFLRSCYSSTWRLFRGSPQPTAGRYYFSPPGTPVYPLPHNLWSQTWVTDEQQVPPVLGEVPALGVPPQTPPKRVERPFLARRPWYKGAAPVSPPAPAILLGTADCVLEGDNPPPAIDRPLVGGQDARCWLNAGLLPPAAPTWGLFSYGGLRAGGATGRAGAGGLLAGGAAASAPGIAGQGGVLAGGAAALPRVQGGGLLGGGTGAASQHGRGGILSGGAATIITGGTTTGCMQCPGGAPAKWQLIVTGFSGGCAPLNGTWTIAYQSACLWEDDPVTTTWTLSGGPMTWTLLGNAGGLTPSYTLAASSFGCLRSNTLALAAGGGCASPPASLTITPI
jgi:hypothetical protein